MAGLLQALTVFLHMATPAEWLPFAARSQFICVELDVLDLSSTAKTRIWETWPGQKTSASSLTRLWGLLDEGSFFHSSPGCLKVVVRVEKQIFHYSQSPSSWNVPPGLPQADSSVWGHFDSDLLGYPESTGLSKVNRASLATLIKPFETIIF